MNKSALQIQKKKLVYEVWNIWNYVLLILYWQIDESHIKDLKKVFLPFKDDALTKWVIINIREVDYMNSLAIGYFVWLMSEFANEWKKIVFSEPSPEIKSIIDLVWLSSIIETYPNNESAYKALNF